MIARLRPLAAGLVPALALALGVALAHHTHAARPLRAQDPAAPPPAPTHPPAAGDLFAQAGRCEACHVDEGWDRLKPPPAGEFDHGTTGFPLRGSHVDVRCDACHRRGLDGLTQSCAACHHDPHAGLHGPSCGRCHNESSWDIARDPRIHERTRFPLTGKHAVLQCEACHRPRRAEPLQTTPMECAACHARAWRRATPNHPAAGFTECGHCHTTSTFRGARYVHRSYVLDGAHLRARCVNCHTGTTFSGLAAGGTDCVACHLGDYNRTAVLANQPGSTTPNHPANNFPTTCAQCHTTTAFRPAR